MAINVIVQYNGGFLPDILLLTQAPIVVWFDGIIIVYYYYLFNYVLHCLLFCFVPSSQTARYLRILYSVIVVVSCSSTTPKNNPGTYSIPRKLTLYNC